MKIFVRIVLSLLLIFIFGSKTQAVDITNNCQGYVIENQRYENVEEAIKKALSQESFTMKQIENVPHAYYEVTPDDEHYYIRFYPADKDTNIYIISDKIFFLKNNILTNILKSLSYETYKLQDKEALKEYKSDFIILARQGVFDGFFVLPDYVKPLKTTVSKVNTYVKDNYKDEVLTPYSEDNNEIYLPLLDTKEYSYNNIRIISKEYRLKNKENKYVHGFEYIITNKGKEPVTLKSVKGESIATLRDVETTALSDLDRLNMLDTMGTVLAIPTGGASLGMKVPNYMQIAKMTKETKRFTKAMPEDKTISPDSQLRILALKFKQNPKPLDFTFEKQGQEFNIKF